MSLRLSPVDAERGRASGPQAAGGACRWPCQSLFFVRDVCRSVYDPVDHRPLIRFGGLLLLALLLSAAGCQTQPDAAPVDGSVRFVEPPPEVVEANRAASEAQAPVRWLVRRVLVRLDHPLEPAWRLADEAVLPDISRAVWNGNGLRVGVLEPEDYGTFGEALGTPVEVRDLQMVNFQHAELLRRSPPLAARFMADLTVPPAPLRQEAFTGGRLQLLLAAAPRGNGSVAVTLTPQHHQPRSSLRPRSAHEKLLDGRVFDELAIDLVLQPRQTLMLGLWLPLAEPDSEAEPATPTRDPASPNSGILPPLVPAAADRDPASSPQDSPPLRVDLTVPDGPLNLGRGLLTTGVEAKNLQVLFLLRPLVGD